MGDSEAGRENGVKPNSSLLDSRVTFCHYRGDILSLPEPRLILVSNNPNPGRSRRKLRANLRLVVSNKREKVA